MPLLSNAAALLKDAMADVNWAGFYLRREPAGCLGVLCDGSAGNVIEILAAAEAGFQVALLDGAALPLPPGMLGNELPGQCKTPE